jgi:hypothetical protein
MAVLALAIAIIAFTLLPRWNRHRVRVTGVSRVRSEMERHSWPPLSPLTPVDGVPSPRIEPSTGPKQPDGSPNAPGTVVPPTFGSVAPLGSAVRCRRTLMFGDLGPNISVRPRRAA